MEDKKNLSFKSMTREEKEEKAQWERLKDFCVKKDKWSRHNPIKLSICFL